MAYGEVYLGASEVTGTVYNLDDRDVHAIVTGKSWYELVGKIGTICTNLDVQKMQDNIEIVVYANKPAMENDSRAAAFLKDYNGYGDIRDVAHVCDEVYDRYLALDTHQCKNLEEYNQKVDDAPMKPLVFVMACASGVLTIPSYKRLLVDILKKGRVLGVHVLFAVMLAGEDEIPEDISNVCSLRIDVDEDTGKRIIKSMFDAD